VFDLYNSLYPSTCDCKLFLLIYSNCCIYYMKVSDIVQFLTQRRKSSWDSFWRNLTKHTMNEKTMKVIGIQTGCLLISFRGKQTREAIHIHLFFSYLEMIIPTVPAFERNLTMGNGFINVSRSCHKMKTQFFSCWNIKKNRNSSRSPGEFGTKCSKIFAVSFEGQIPQWDISASSWTN